MPTSKSEWKKVQSIGHATTRLVFINANLVRELIPDANAKTIIGGKWSVTEISDGKTPEKALVLKLKKFEKWPPQ
jgi:hypothetical protein